MVPVFAGVALVALLPGAAPPQRPRGPAPTRPRLPALALLRCSFESADLKKGVLKVRTRDGLKDVPLNRLDVPLTGDVSPGTKLGALPRGTHVVLRISARADVVGVHCIGPQVRAKIKSIDAKHRTVTLGDGKALPLAPGALVSVGTRFPPLADVPAGRTAVLRLDVGRKQVRAAQVPGDAARLPPLDDRRTAEGTVEAIDLARGVLALRADGDKAEGKPYPLHAAVRVSLVDGRGNGLADLMPGMKAKLWLGGDGKTALFVRAEPTIKAALRSVDLEKRTITLAAFGGEKGRAFLVPKDALLMVNGWECELQDFFEDDAVSIVLDRKGRLRAMWALSNFVD